MTVTLLSLQQQLIEIIANSPYFTSIDLSKWKESFDIDTEDLEVILQILDGVIIRMGYGGATTGNAYKDIRFDEFWAELLQHPEIIRMFYWYFSSETLWELQRDKIFEILEEIGDDWEVFWVDMEAINNKRSAGFALTGLRLAKAIKAKYPDKKVGIYSNKYIYQDWLRYYSEEYDDWDMWIAQYPWADWVASISSYFVNWWNQVFTTLTKRPPMPASRGADDWELWQIGDKTGLGNFLGLGKPNVDFNISRRSLGGFKDWIGNVKRWKPEVPES